LNPGDLQSEISGHWGVRNERHSTRAVYETAGDDLNDIAARRECEFELTLLIRHCRYRRPRSLGRGGDLRAHDRTAARVDHTPTYDGLGCRLLDTLKRHWERREGGSDGDEETQNCTQHPTAHYSLHD
jgi:hypothetical protein